MKIMTEETALKIISLAMGEDICMLNTELINVVECPDNNDISIIFSDEHDRLNYCLDYCIKDIIEFSASQFNESWFSQSVEIKNAAKVILLFEEWKRQVEANKLTEPPMS